VVYDPQVINVPAIEQVLKDAGTYLKTIEADEKSKPSGRRVAVRTTLYRSSVTLIENLKHP
jgi:hypothetical protein